jgi:hypothetical protein
MILGFDETNNGFGLRCFNKNHESNLIITAYLSDEVSMKDYERPDYESKGRIFTGERNISSALRRGRVYLEEHQDFLYTSVPRDAQLTTPIAILKAEAVALLTLNFFLQYELDEKNVKIIMDEMDGKNQSIQINQVLDLWLKKAGLSIPHRSMRSAASRIHAVRKADMVGYYLTAIHFLGENRKWPYRSHRIGFNELEKSVVEFLERRDNDYS